MRFPSPRRLRPFLAPCATLLLTCSMASPASSNAVSPGPAPSCISLGNPCITIPVSIARTDAALLRGSSVTFTLSADLMLCGPVGTNVVRGPYLATGAGVNGTQYLVLNNGGGSYTVDEAILGTPCGAVGAGGVLFTINVTNSGGDGIGTVTINSVTLRDCANGPIASTVGAPLPITIDNTNPSFIADLAAAQQPAANDADGTTKVHLGWTATEAGSSVEIFRKGFGFYPEYDDLGGAAPVAPGTPAAALGDGWVSAGTVSSPTAVFADEVASPRDFYYYVAFVTDGCGNVSAVSIQTDGTLNYHLGDVSDGLTPGQGDNQVGTPDVSLLGANYGLIGGAVVPVNYLDIGPTTDFSVNARPTTDNRIQFEDLILFAINYGSVSAPGVIAEGTTSGPDALALETEGAVAPGEELLARLTLTGSGRIQGLSIPLSWNAAVVEPIGMDVASGLEAQGGVAFAPAAGAVDAALLGVRETGLAGEVGLATVRFRVIGSGDPAIGIGDVIARDAQNRPVSLGTTASTDGARPSITALSPPAPNPFSKGTTLAFSLATAGRLELAVFSVDGRRVRLLASGPREVGFYREAWDGTDDAGRRVPAGVYYAALIGPAGNRQSRTITLLGK